MSTSKQSQANGEHGRARVGEGIAGRVYLKSEQLFAGTREVIIEHAGNEYRLRLTSQGKLILTK